MTISYACQTVVLSLPALRRLHFPAAGQRPTTERDQAAWTVLAALGLCGAVLSIEQGCDLRSRCLLVPDACAPGAWEFVKADGKPEEFSLTGAEACEVLRCAATAAGQAGLSWLEQPLTLVPSAALAELVRRSRALAMQVAPEGE